MSNKPNSIILAVGVKTLTIGERKEKFNIDPMWHYDRDSLKEAIERKYGVTLIKKDEDDFPWFTDGGFKYSFLFGLFEYEVSAFVTPISNS